MPESQGRCVAAHGEKLHSSLKPRAHNCGLSQLDFRVSRFGDSHGSLVQAVAIAKTAQDCNPTFQL